MSAQPRLQAQRRRDRALAGGRRRNAGFTLLELMVVVVIVAILAAIAYPSYTQYTIRASREAAESQLMELANTQERVFLNSSAYSSSVTAAYTGQSTGGLGLTSGKTSDGKYTISVANPTTTTFTLTATPDPAKGQKNDGNLSIDQAGKRLWGSATW